MMVPAAVASCAAARQFGARRAAGGFVEACRLQALQVVGHNAACSLPGL